MSSSLWNRIAGLWSSSDEQAMWQVKLTGDIQAFTTLVERWRPAIHRLCTRMLGDEHRGEDLAQEVFARLYTRREQYEPSGRFSTYLWRIALNLCYDELRKIQRRGELPHEDADAEPGAPSDGLVETEQRPDQQLLERERAETVRHALLALEEPYRVVVVLRHYEGLKFREISDILGIPEGTVKSRMAEALDQLHRQLTEIFNREENVCVLPQTQRNHRPVM